MRLASISILGALALGIGCSSDQAPPRDVSLSIKVGDPSAAAGVSRLLLSLPDGIELTRVRVVLREVELENEGEGSDDGDDHGGGSDDGMDDNGGGSDDGMDDNGGEADGGLDDSDGGTDDGLDDNGDDGTDGSNASGEQEIEFGPLLVDLDGAALGGDIIQSIVSALVPQGTYDELKFKIGPVDAQPGDSPELAELTQNGLSVLIEGTIDGEPFTMSSSLEARQKVHVNIVVGDGGSDENLTLFLNADTWFVDASTGERLDPRDPAGAEAIANNIRDSIHAEDDDDHDGIGDESDEDDDDSGDGHEGDDSGDDHGGGEDDGGTSGSH